MVKIQKKFDIEISFVELLNLAKSGRWISEEDFVKCYKLLKTDLLISTNGSELRVRDLYEWVKRPNQGPAEEVDFIVSRSFLSQLYRTPEDDTKIPFCCNS